MTSLPFDWRKLMLDEYRAGGFDVEVCSILQISQKEFEAKFNIDGDFQDAVLFGRMLCKAWWYSQCRKGLRDKTFNTALFYATMKNLFGWSDKVADATKEIKTIEEMSEDEIRSELVAKAKAFEKSIKGQGISLNIKDLINVN